MSKPALPLRVQMVILTICRVCLAMHAAVWFVLSEQHNVHAWLLSLPGQPGGIAVIPLSMRGQVGEFAFFL